MNSLELINIGKQFTFQHEQKDAQFIHEPQHVQKRKRTFWALKDINLEIQRGQILGLVGRNGAGKTTLLKIIAGIIEPTEGIVHVNGEVQSLINLGTGFQGELSGKENIYLNASILGMSNEEIGRKYRDIVNFSELNEFIDMPIGNYSQGMRLRLGFSIAMHLDFEIFLLDEVLTVGDLSFQKKCFEQLTQFKREGKTMIVTTQSLAMLERLSDELVLIEEGKICAEGKPADVIYAYNEILNENRELHIKLDTGIVRQARWWFDDAAGWGTREGTGEATVDKVRIMNRWGKEVDKVIPGSYVKIQLQFTVNEQVEDPHFGIALFRKDGVYCYGPNTRFDQIYLGILNKGPGTLTLEYPNFDLMPGEYIISVVIWDLKEVIAYDYLVAYFPLDVIGENRNGQLLTLDSRFSKENRSLFQRNKLQDDLFDIAPLKAHWMKKTESPEVELKGVETLDVGGRACKEFYTGDEMRIKVSLSFPELKNKKGRYLWIGLFRKDGIFCYAKYRSLQSAEETSTVIFPHIRLLPGEYLISVIVWDDPGNEPLLCHHGIYPFNICSEKQDHGTFWLEHVWHIKLPGSDGKKLSKRSIEGS